jgi:hypothetical protein
LGIASRWAVAAKELGFPKPTDGKRMVKEWRTGRWESTPQLVSKLNMLGSVPEEDS